MQPGGNLEYWPERPQSVCIFLHALVACPDIIAGEIDVFPAEGGEMNQQAIWNSLDLAKGSRHARGIGGSKE